MNQEQTTTATRATRIDKRQARRVFNTGGRIAVSGTPDHDTITGWLSQATTPQFKTFADIEQLNTESVRVGTRLYWYEPVTANLYAYTGDEHVNTPFTVSDADRYSFDALPSRSSRSVEVTDLNTGDVWVVRRASCGGGCFCAASAVRVVMKHRAVGGMTCSQIACGAARNTDNDDYIRLGVTPNWTSAVDKVTCPACLAWKGFV